MCCEGNEAATCLHNELWFTLQTVTKLNVMAVAVWWREVVKKSFGTNLHVHAVIHQFVRPHPHVSTRVMAPGSSLRKAICISLLDI